MPDQSPKSDVDRTRGSIKEAIGKIIGDRKAIRRGAAEKIAVAPDTPRSPVNTGAYPHGRHQARH